MPQKEIDFRELLERLLPLEQLPPASRLAVQRALVSGVATRVQEAGILALRELERQGALKRIPVTGPLLRYQRRDAFDIITVPLPVAPALEGIEAHPRALLPPEAEARIDRVRALIQLDDANGVTGPTPERPDVHAQIDRAGREFLDASEVRFVPALPRDDTATAPPPLDAELARTVRAHPDAVYYCPDVGRAPRLERAQRGTALAVALAAARTAEGVVVGHLEVLCATRDPFRAADLVRVALLADSAASLVARAARIETLAFVDPLTAVYNRSYFDLQVRNEMARAGREHASMALVMADIDDFKAFNSAYGYEGGNRVLVEVAQALRHGVRPFDTVARWGGEEFAILLTAPVHAGDVGTVSERLRGLVERHLVALEGLDGRPYRVGVTVSLGVSMFPDHAADAQELFRAANQALLEAKRPPKNRVVFYRQITAAPRDGA